MREAELEVCHLKLTIDEVEACPGGKCPFWEESPLEVGCGLERLDLDLARPDLAAYLLDLREKLEQARDDLEREAARQAFPGPMPPDPSGASQI